MSYSKSEMGKQKSSYWLKHILWMWLYTLWTFFSDFIGCPVKPLDNFRNGGLISHLNFKNIKRLCLITNGFLLCACIDQIDLDFVGEHNYLVINGQVTNLPEPYTVSLKRSSDFSQDQIPIEKPVEGAKVFVQGNDQSLGWFIEEEAGFYRSDPKQFMGKLGTSYQLNVELDDQARYVSSWETVLPVPEMGDVQFTLVTESRLNVVENIVYEKKVQVSTDVYIPSGPTQSFLRWELDGEYQFNEQKPLRPGETNKTCYVKDDLLLGASAILDVSGLDNNQVLSQKLIKLDLNYKLASAYCMHIKQHSLSANAFAFWSAANDLNEKKGNLFDELPGRIRGNMTNVDQKEEQIFGYFYTSAVREKRIFVPMEILENQTAPCPANDAIFTGVCHNCLVLQNSTHTKPDYWIE